jgi:hypothetical protein
MKNEPKIYNSELALDVRQAKYHLEIDIEIVELLPKNLNIQKVILDHDRTISTLREGWKAVMLPVVIASICGDKISELSTDEYNTLSKRCSQFIDEIIGIQTIVQI